MTTVMRDREEAIETMKTLPPHVRDLLDEAERLNAEYRAIKAKIDDVTEDIKDALVDVNLGACPEWCDGVSRYWGSHEWRFYCDERGMLLMREHRGRNGTRYTRQYERLHPDGSRDLQHASSSPRPEYIG